MKRAVAVRHVPFEDLGTLVPLLVERGFEVTYRDAGIDDLSILDKSAPELLVVLGGPVGACDDAAYPFLTAELALIEKRLAENRAVLGICLGAQLMARALGASVRSMSRKEIGFGSLSLTQSGRSSALAEMRPETTVLHWHGDTFDVPQGAQLLAATSACPNQAFAMGKHALGLQFHLEVETCTLERWLIGHAAELAAAGIAPGLLRAQSLACGDSLREASAVVFGRWLDQIDFSSTESATQTRMVDQPAQHRGNG